MKNNWLIEIDTITSNFEKEFRMLSMDDLNWKPNASTWSIGQNIDHLVVINDTYHPNINALRNGTYKLPFHAKFNFIVNFIGITILKAVEPERKKKMKTFTVWEPTKSAIKETIWDRFLKSQAELKTLIKNSTDLITKGTVIASPANRIIVYKLETAFDVIVNHEKRHFNQALELAQLLKQARK
jgi:hypothetical protein